VSEKFGQGVLLNFIMGKYHRPKEEMRIFMFMDLKSSTTYAEKLGHIKYSQLIQDCFYDLTDIVIAHHAQIYQYVGDEVVLTWEMKKGLENRNCILTFFEYDRVIQGKSAYYHKKYGLIPEFKAGVNLGNVTTAEVGELKKELAYHGDVLNTAARIEGKCNDFQRRLLVSQDVKERMEDESQITYELMGNIELRGKEQLVNIYAIRSI
jgi:adenylate cyclase